MANVNYKQIMAIHENYKKEWLKVNPHLTEQSGIYMLTREENGFKYAYIGQSVNILNRLAQHSEGYKTQTPTHIDLSLKSHGLYSKENPTGWQVEQRVYPRHLLNEKEVEFAREYANNGYQLRNKTGGSQGQGKFGINYNKPAKGYRDGLIQGRKNAIREIKHIIDLHLDVSVKSATKPHLKALDKFNDILSEVENE